ncbi:MAG: hypothetical protein IJM06_02290 [Firmicutes bacterium]|nr:hypothetical protein [Bacillota bacterium]
MNFCPNCGTKITDPELGCPNCKTSTVNSANTAAEPEKAAPAGGSKPANDKNQGVYRNFTPPADEKNFSNGLKVLFVTISLIIPVAGMIFGIVAAIILMTKPSKDYKSFGLALLILNIILLVFFLFCCVFAGSSVLNNPKLQEEMKENLYDYFENAKTLSMLGM